MPLVSVIIPLYNHEKYVEESVNSVLNQTIDDLELIIINDGSSDKSEEIVREIKDGRIKYFSQQNHGAHYTLNKGIKTAQGEYISLLNSDDIYSANRIEKCLDIFNDDLSVEAVFSALDYIDERGEPIRLEAVTEELEAYNNRLLSSKEHNILTMELLKGNFLKTTSNLFCKKKCIDKIGIFRNLRYAHDYDLFLKLSYFCTIDYIIEPLLKYRVHPGNTLKESQAAIDLECILVVADFLTSHDLNCVFNSEDISAIDNIFSSLNTNNGERILLSLIIYSSICRSNMSILDLYIDNKEHNFWQKCHQYLNDYHDGWKARDILHDEWNKLFDLYKDQGAQLERAKGSKSYRVGEFLKKLLNR